MHFFMRTMTRKLQPLLAPLVKPPGSPHSAMSSRSSCVHAGRTMSAKRVSDCHQQS